MAQKIKIAIIQTAFSGISLFMAADPDEVAFSKLFKQKPASDESLILPRQDAINLVDGTCTWPVTRGNKDGSIVLDYDVTVVIIGDSRIEVITKEFIPEMHRILGLAKV